MTRDTIKSVLEGRLEHRWDHLRAKTTRTRLRKTSVADTHEVMEITKPILTRDILADRTFNEEHELLTLISLLIFVFVDNFFSMTCISGSSVTRKVIFFLCI